MTSSVLHWHESPTLITFAAQPLGRIATWLVATALMVYLDVVWLMPATALAVIAMPNHRLAITGIAAITVTGHQDDG